MREKQLSKGEGRRTRGTRAAGGYGVQSSEARRRTQRTDKQDAGHWDRRRKYGEQWVMHTQPCPGHLPVPLRTHCLGVLWTPRIRVASGTYQPPGCFQSPEREALQCPWHHSPRDDRGQRVDEHFLLGTLGDQESVPGKAQTGDPVFCSSGDGPRWENRIRGNASGAACPPQRSRLEPPPHTVGVGSCHGCEHGLWT